MFTKAVICCLLVCCMFGIAVHSKDLSSRLRSSDLTGSRPNIIVLLNDDLGWGDVGCFGNTSMRTPNIDRMCGDGVALTQHLATASVCTPSRTSLLTGRYAIREGVVPTNIMRVFPFPSSTGGLPSNITTVATLASSAGYYSAFIGKWHLGLHCGNSPDFCHHPLKHGFQYFYGHPITNIKDTDGESSVVDERLPILAPTLLFASGLLSLMSLRFIRKGRSHLGVSLLLLVLLIVVVNWMLHSLTILTSMLYRDYRLVEMPAKLELMSQRLIDESLAAMDRSQQSDTPLFLFISWIHVHTALHVMPEFRGRSNFGLYGDAVEELDWSIGQILRGLEDRHMIGNTFVYMTSDNGGHTLEFGHKGDVQGGFNGIWKGGKTMGALEGGIRVPSTVMWPGVIPSGQRLDRLTKHLDLLPTIADLIGVSVPDHFPSDGSSLLPLLLGEEDDKLSNFMAHYCGDSIHGARYDDGIHLWKLYYKTPTFKPGTVECFTFVCDCWLDITVHNPPLLYDLRADPGEEHPISNSDTRYLPVVDDINRMVQQHTDSVLSVDMQMTWDKLMIRPWLQPCCNFPSCTCTDPSHP